MFACLGSGGCLLLAAEIKPPFNAPCTTCPPRPCLNAPCPQTCPPATIKEKAYAQLPTFMAVMFITSHFISGRLRRFLVIISLITSLEKSTLMMSVIPSSYLGRAGGG